MTAAVVLPVAAAMLVPAAAVMSMVVSLMVLAGG